MKTNTLQRQHTGFTLVEVMVSLLLFAVGMLGIALQLAKGASVSGNNDIHSGVMQVAMQSVEPLKMAIKSDRETFQTALKKIGSDINSATFNTNNSDIKSMSINVFKAVDSTEPTSLNLLDDTVDISAWRPPYTIVVEVSYTDGEGTSMDPFYSSYVLF